MWDIIINSYISLHLNPCINQARRPQGTQKFNPDKCKLLRLGNSSPTNCYLHNPTECSRSLISSVTKEKDISIWCTSEMKPSYHCIQVEKAVAEAMQTLGYDKEIFQVFIKRLVSILVQNLRQTTSSILCTNSVTIFGKRLWYFRAYTTSCCKVI